MAKERGVEISPLGEVLGSLSLATDLAAGHPAESAISATIVATRFARLAGVPADELQATYYASLTRMIGCTATTVEMAQVAAGHDRTFILALLKGDWTEPEQVAGRLRDMLPDDVPEDAREVAARNVVANFDDVGAGAMLHCAQAVLLTSRLPLPDTVPTLLGYLWSRWDGSFPGAVGDEIPLPARIIPLARAVDQARRSGGSAAAIRVAHDRRGSEFDPALVDLFVSVADDLFDGLSGPTLWETFLATEPGPRRSVGSEELIAIADVFADFVDQKSGWFAGHSRRVALLAAAAARGAGLDAQQQRGALLAGLLHDIGRTAVPNGIWEKPGALTSNERRMAESHDYHTMAVLRRSATFEEFADVAATAHERADGSGYHRGVRPTDPLGGILATADVYDALVSERPWRAALRSDEAVAEIQRMCADGLLSPDSAAATLRAVAGDDSIDPTYPAGLTSREVEVVRLLVTGMPTKTIASRLSISPKTADKHIQNIYDKTGVRGRAPIALFAVDHGLMVH